MLRNRTILITGSSRGIGAAIAKLAEKYGAKVILHGRETFDVSDEEAVEREISKLPSIDILINNAGINPSKTFLELSSKDWKDIFDTNVFGLVNVSRAVLKGMMKRKKGKIVNIASIKAYNTTSGKPAYAASKAAVMRITSSMAEEFAPYGILVNAVAPGFVETEMTKASMSPKIEAQIKKIPLKRMAQPEEIAEAVLFLASDKANYITGQTLLVDGGYSIAG